MNLVSRLLWQQKPNSSLGRRLRFDLLEGREVPANLILNSGVENLADASRPANFNSNAWGTNQASFSIVNTGALDGARSIRVDMASRSSGDAKWFADDVAVTAGKEYVFSNNYTSNVTTQNTIRYRMTDGSYQYVWAGSVAAAASKTTNTFTFTAIQGAVAATVFHLIDNVGFLTTDSYSIDDKTATPPPPPPTPGTNLIQNPTLGPGTGNPTGWNTDRWGTISTTFNPNVTGPNGARALRVEVTSRTSGDAKWFFNDVAVSQGQYNFSESYRSNATSVLVARYRMTDGSFQYSYIDQFASTNGTWANLTKSVTVPAGVVSLTMFHVMPTVGYLETSQHVFAPNSIVPPPPPPPPSGNGRISLTFDDGWVSQYTNALPILRAENVPASFYIISRANTANRDLNFIANSSLETDGVAGNPQGWSRWQDGNIGAQFNVANSGSAGNRSGQLDISNANGGRAAWAHTAFGGFREGATLTISHQFRANVPTTTFLQLTRNNGSTYIQQFATHASTNNTWQTHTADFTVPSDVDAIQVLHTISQAGQLNVDNFSIIERTRYANPSYMNPDQINALEDQGFEIGAHSRTHASMTGISEAAALAEINGSRQDLLDLGINTVNTYVYPYGDFNNRVVDQTRNSGFIGARSVIEGFNTPTTNRYALMIQTIDRDTTLAQVQSWTAQAAAQGRWLILMFHQVDYNAGDIYGTTPEFLQQVIDTAQASNLTFTTMRQGLQTYVNA